MRFFYLTLLLLFTYSLTFSQGPQMGGGLKGRVYGKVLDEKGAAIDFATIVLMQAKIDTVTKEVKYAGYRTMTTEANGEFSFEDFTISPKMIVRISSFGYVTEDVEIPFDRSRVSMGVMQIDLGRISLSLEEASELDVVKITATIPLMELDVDKRVFDVGKSQVAEGGTAIEVLENVPGVNVDIDGNVQVRNAPPQIYIDGRPTTLTLDQIPASSIDKVEVMTNPSAKFDASGGGAGIINIILKKNRKTGYNGSVRAGMDSNLGYFVGGDINVRQNKLNFSLSLNHRAHRGRTMSDVLRENYRENDTLDNIMTQDDINKRKGGGFFGRFGVDYLPTNKTSFSLGLDLWRGAFRTTSVSDINTDSVYLESPELYYYERLNTTKRDMLNYGINFGYKQLFNREGEELTFDASFNQGNFNSNSLYTSNYHLTDVNSPLDYVALQKILGEGNYHNAVFQTDYVVPLPIFKIETGLRAQLRGRTNENNNYRHLGGDYVLLPNPASNYLNSDNVYAAYFILSHRYGKFGYKAGLRAESSDYKGELTVTGEEFKVQYPISLFPSVFLSYKLTDNQDLQLNYSRRVNRPTFFQIVPFVDSVDVFNMSKGNAGLKPEFTDNIELQYLNSFTRKHTLLASVYYKYTSNLITRYIEKADDGSLINTYINANSSYSTGFELISTNSIQNWLDMTTSVNVYNAKINSSAYQSWATDARWAWYAKMNLMFKLPLQFSIQVSGMYQSKSSLPIVENQRMWGPSPIQSSSQGYLSDYWALDVSIKKMFLDRKLSVNLSVSDIFGSKHYISVSQSDYFYQKFDRISNPYMIRLSVNWNFGKIDTSLFKRLSRGTGESSME